MVLANEASGPGWAFGVPRFANLRTFFFLVRSQSSRYALFKGFNSGPRSALSRRRNRPSGEKAAVLPHITFLLSKNDNTTLPLFKSKTVWVLPPWRSRDAAGPPTKSS